MLEIIILIKLSKRIATRAREKGRSGAGYVCLLLALWIGGELGGGFAVGVFSLALNPRAAEPDLLLVYGGALLCAILGAILAFKIIDWLPGPEEDWLAE